MPKPKLVEITAKLVDLLTPLESEERHRAVEAAFTLLGEPSVATEKHSIKEKKEKLLRLEISHRELRYG